MKVNQNAMIAKFWFLKRSGTPFKTPLKMYSVLPF